MQENDIVIVAAKRTPMGNLLGALSTQSAPDLGAVAHRAALAQATLSPEAIDEVILGCVLQAGIGQAPARQSAIYAGMPESVGATTINKMCGSGMKAVMLAHDLIRAGSAKIILAGGMESMSQAPYLLKKARSGYRLGHGQCLDHLFLDGLEDAYEPGKLMGVFADEAANTYGFTRDIQDAYAIESMRRALAAQQNGAFDAEIAPVSLKQKHHTQTISQDEGPDQSKLAKVATLRPAFDPHGTVTAANASSISDGAASLILMSAHEAKSRGIQPLARILAHASHAQAPNLFTSAPVSAIQSVFNQTGWNHTTVDLFEINEAFAVVALITINALKLDPTKVNIHGGACALGHPIGASGARILVTLIHALQQQNKRRGIASLCIGGGEATAMAIELME